MHGRRFTLEMTGTGHYGSRQAKYRILLQTTPSGALFILIHSCIMFFCSILFPPGKLHHLKLITFGLGLQKLALQVHKFCQSRGGAKQFETVLIVQGITLKTPKGSAKAAQRFPNDSCGCVIPQHHKAETGVWGFCLAAFLTLPSLLSP